MQILSDKCQILNNEELGCHLVSGIDISPGDTILEEKPLLIAPHWESVQMRCSQCFNDSYIICKNCHVFPLCIDCTTHSEYDCDFFQTRAKNIDKDLLVKNYAIYGPLKLLLLMEDPKTFIHAETILKKNLNLDEYRDSDLWNEITASVVDPLLKCGIAELFTRFEVDADFLHKLCILIDANSLEVFGQNDIVGDSLKGVYMFSAQLPHNCVPNTAVAITDNFQLKIYATVLIENGSVIYHSYANPLMGTSQRQHHLRMIKHIECCCSRCLDPTELGTHMSSMKCQECTDGYAVSDLGKSENWICMICKAVMDATEVNELLVELGEEMVHANGDLSVYESLLATYLGRFHKNHFLVIDIKQNIATILRAILMDPICNPGKKVLERRVQLCEDILPVVRAVLPGISKLYAIAVYEYLLPFLELAEMEIRDEEITVDDYLGKQEKAKHLALTAKEILAFEPPNSPEGQLVWSIDMEMKHIQGNINKHSVEK